MGIASVLALGLKGSLKTKAGKHVVSRDGKMFIDEKGGAEVALKDLDSDSLKQWVKDNTIYRGDAGAAPTEANLFDGNTKGHPATHASYDITEALSYAGRKDKPTDTPGVSEANLYSSANYPDTTRLLDYKTNPDELASIADTVMQNKGYKRAPDLMKARAYSGDWQELENKDFVAEAKKRGYNMIRQSGEGDNVQIFPGAVPKTFATERVLFGDNLMLDPQNIGKLTAQERKAIDNPQVDNRDAFVNPSYISMSSNPHAFAAPMTRILHGGIRAGKTKDEIVAQAEKFLPYNEGAVGRNNIARTDFLDQLKTMPTDASGKPDQAKLGDWLKQTGLYSSAGVLGLGLASQSEDVSASDEIKIDEKGNPYTSKRMTTEEYNQFIDKKATTEAARLAKKEQPQFVIDNAVSDIQKLKEVATKPPSTLVEQMRTAGYSNKEIYQAFADKGKTQDEIDKEFGGMLTKAKAQFTSPEDQALFNQDFSYAPSTNAKTLELPELTAQLEKLNRDNWSTGKAVQSLWDDKTAKEVQEYTSAIQPKLVEGLLKRGYQAKLMVQDGNAMRDAQEGEVPNVAAVLDPKTKQFVPATSDFISGLTSSALSITGGVTGAMSGAELGMAAPIPHPIAKGAAVLGGAIAGGAAGTFAGSVADDLVTAAKLNEDFDAQKAVNFAAQEGLTSAIFDAGLVGLLKSPAAVGQLAKVTKRYLEDANVQGAYRALKDITGVTDQQADDYIKQVNAMSKAPLDGSQTRQRINAIAQTQKGAEAIVPQASQLSKSGGFNFAKEIDTRAKDFTASVDTVTPENVGKVITDDLAKYQQSVRDGYEGIKSFGIAQADSVGYHFDIDKFKIDSMLEDANVRITDPAVLQQFDTLMAKVKSIGAGGPRSFSDLLDLRKTISDFKYKNGTTNYIKLDRVNTVLNSIDGEIEEAAKAMPNGTQWLEEFAKSKIDYAQMKGLEKNALYKALNRPGISAEQVVSAVAQKAGSIDGTFMEVLGKLPMQTRVNAEGAVMKHLLGKHTIGDGQSYQAVDFPALVEKLDTLEFTTKENRELKRVAQEFARVFRNDKALAEASGAINVPKPTSYLATSVEGRLRVQAMSEMFNSVSKYLPTKEGRMKALADKVADVLDSPTNAKATETLLRELPADPALKESLSKLAIEYTKRGQKETYPQVTTYQVFNPGRTRDAMQTRLGKGMLYFTDEAKAKAYANGQGLQVKATQVEPTRFATPQQIEQITGEPFSMQQLRDPAVLSKLRVKGYTGVAEGDEALEFNYRAP